LRVHVDRAVTFADAVARLETALRIALPGPAGQAHMAPVPRRAWPKGFNTARVRHAAGLLLVFPKSAAGADSAASFDAADIVLTVRGDTPRHAGQVSLPGGVVEPGETFEQAALREAHEEVALERDDVRVLGALTPLDIPVSGFRLYPIVASLDRQPRLAAAAREDGAFIGVAMHGLCPP